MKIKKDTITFERNDNIFFDGSIISNGHIAIDLNVMLCFKFKFPDERLLVAFTNKQKFTYQNKQVAIDGDCVWIPDMQAAFSMYDVNKYYSAETTPLQWNGVRCVAGFSTGKYAWIEEGYVSLTTGYDCVVQNADQPLYVIVGGVAAICIMPIRLTTNHEELILTDKIVNLMCEDQH